jgi:hypothetical protein
MATVGGRMTDERDDEEQRPEPPGPADILNMYIRSWREQFGDPGVSIRDKARRFGVELSMPQQRLGAMYELLGIADLVLAAWQEFNEDPEAGPGRIATRALNRHGGLERLDTGAAKFLVERGIVAALLDLKYPPQDEEDHG